MMSKTVTVEFVLVGSNNSPITSEDAECMSVVAESIRLSARLVDMPCQDMHTSAFVEVNAVLLAITLIGHLRVALCLIFKTSPCMKMGVQVKLIFI